MEGTTFIKLGLILTSLLLLTCDAKSKFGKAELANRHFGSSLGHFGDSGLRGHFGGGHRHFGGGHRHFGGGHRHFGGGHRHFGGGHRHFGGGHRHFGGGHRHFGGGHRHFGGGHEHSIGRYGHSGGRHGHGMQGCREGTKVYDQCGQRCTCSRGNLINCFRIRKEFAKMTTGERRRYIRAAKIVSTDESYKTDYYKLINIHYALFHTDIHEKTHFLTWHRWFGLEYENLLRRIDCRVTLAFWDWSFSDSPWSTANPTDLWYNGDTGFGGNGTGTYSCVQTGPFREGEWSWEVPEGAPTGSPSACLRREFSGDPPDDIAVQEVLKMPATNFTEFEVGLRVNLHDLVHQVIGGTMFTFTSAAAPEFFLHHAFVDKLWNDWQEKSEDRKNAFFSTLTENMPNTTLLPREVIDLTSLPGGVKVEYQTTQAEAKDNSRYKDFSLNRLHRIPHRKRFSRLSNKAFEMFRTRPADRARAKQLEKVLEPLSHRRPWH